MLSSLIFVLSTCQATATPTFSPDRPGVGESTSTPGAGNVLIEGGVNAMWRPGSLSGLGLRGIVGRIGVHKAWEARVMVPDLNLQNHQVGAFGIGAKAALQPSEELGLSVVGSLYYNVGAGALESSVSGNLTYTIGALSPWFNLTATQVGDAVTLAPGGGLAIAVPGGGIYLHGWRPRVGSGAVGVGGWFLLSPRWQVDLGLDALAEQAGVTWTPGLGSSVAF